MYRLMEDWTDIRERVASGKVSKRAILRETGMHWKTLKKILTHSEPPGYRLRQSLRDHAAEAAAVLRLKALYPTL